ESGFLGPRPHGGDAASPPANPGGTAVSKVHNESRTTVSAARATVLARPPLAGWRSIDIITVAMLGVAFGVGYWGWDQAYNVLSPAFNGFPPSSRLVGGVWLLAGVVCGLVVRRPGAAVFGELVAASVELTLGNSWGATTFVSGLI